MIASARTHAPRPWNQQQQPRQITMRRWLLLVLMSACSSSEREATSSESASSILALPQQTDSARRLALAYEQDSAPSLRTTRLGDSLRFEVLVERGAQLNALLPPVIELDGGGRVVFQATGVTADSAYLTGPTTAVVARLGLPAQGLLRTSYCRASERLCRTGRRVVRLSGM